MTIPDLLLINKLNLNAFARKSIYEDPSLQRDLCDGLWIDCFKGEILKAIEIESLAMIHKNIAFVSPELHGFNEDELWNIIKGLAVKSSNVMICTDLPYKANYYFHE